MLKKIISLVLIPAFLLQVVGCYTQNIISRENLSKYKDEKIRVVTNDNKVYMGNPNYWLVQNDTLDLNNYNFSEGIVTQKIPLTSIKDIYVKQISAAATILLLAGLAAGIFLIASAFSSNHGSNVNLYNMTF